MCVNKMNLLKLAPGGQVGRFVIWTESAFQRLNALFGSWKEGSKLKKGYNLPQPKMANTDLSRILKSAEIRKVLRDPRKQVFRSKRRLNPLTNKRQLFNLNPYAEVLRRRAILAVRKRKMERAVESAKRRGVTLKPTHKAVKGLKLIDARKKQILKAAAVRKQKRAGKPKAAKK